MHFGQIRATLSNRKKSCKRKSKQIAMETLKLDKDLKPMPVEE